MADRSTAKMDIPELANSPNALDEVTGALESLAQVLGQEEEFGVLLQAVCEQVARAVPGVDEVTVTLIRDGAPYTAAATTRAVVELDGEQYRVGDGPCLEAARTGRLVRIALRSAQAR